MRFGFKMKMYVSVGGLSTTYIAILGPQVGGGENSLEVI